MRCTQPRPTPTPIPSHPIPSHPCLLRCLHDVHSEGELRSNEDAHCTHLLSDLVDHHLSSSETTDIFIRSLQQSLAGYIQDLETQQVTQPKWVSTLLRDIGDQDLETQQANQLRIAVRIWHEDASSNNTLKVEWPHYRLVHTVVPASPGSASSIDYPFSATVQDINLTSCIITTTRTRTLTLTLTLTRAPPPSSSPFPGAGYCSL
jgi:hypothetical protein